MSVQAGDPVFVHAMVTRFDDHTYPSVEVEIEHDGGKLVRSFHCDDLFWPPRPQVSSWQVLYGPVRALINRVNAALFDDRLDDAMCEVSPMHMRTQQIINAQALLASDVARQQAIRAIVAAQWAVAIGIAIVWDRDDGPLHTPTWSIIEMVGSLPTAEQIMDNEVKS